MTQTDKATQFKALHVPGDPLMLYNIWDAGGAKAVEAAGAKAIATGSHSVAEAHGYDDGEQIPLDLVFPIATRIAASTALPVTIDFEGAYSTDPAKAADNVAGLIATGAIGLNFEDQVVGGQGLHPTADQVARIKAIRDCSPVPFFINARTDVFLKAKPDAHEGLLDEAITRGKAYADAGADGFFIPGLLDAALVAQVCKAVPLPVNVMMRAPLTRESAAEAGVGRISHGPIPYAQAMKTLQEVAVV
ncbi:2-methylisocitrate lyase-like PEP mutase family enzyme [Litoreibacter ponti]|uniref:2-methylisocitrate lyase-like PEP mutase family enzyme n=1 Tax=Litoreibacter ponti TaxID=1510457 RepID=A0A2T6BMQ3_9RHOB|nr:isocitrate lyase/phosphoenolpyruvate mutase family protein [Litoreibacter ponti]PTX57345.1 2-methylisocitrate lyase-like PEP mutase family enzyme [Litoreibacter ponti]